MYTIDNDKLENIVQIFNNETDPAATNDLIKAEIIAPCWTEGNEHQEWINNATAQEIADWLASFYN